MSHPFEVGKTYRNRVGEYVVEDIQGDTMKIRYVGGGTLVTDVNIQARIWENIQFEKQLARTEERQRQAQEARRAARQRSVRARRTRARPTFDGFEENDFDVQTRGIAWKGRRDLGRVLAYELNRRVGDGFDHWIVPYQSEVHVARKDHYDADLREYCAALFVSASEDGVSYGFHVGKPGGKAKGGGNWSTLVDSLAKDEGLRQVLRSAMEQHQLRLVLYAMGVSYGQVGQITVQDGGFLFEHETADQTVTQEMTGKEVADHLQDLAPNKRTDLYLGRQVSVADALKAGSGIADEIATVYQSLVKLYDASVGA
jgi:hypothetical protein